jgi:hypothetical protein
MFHVLAYSPYAMWLANKAGDCNDYATFAIFVANYHGYETYQILLYYYNEESSHMLGVFVEGKYTYSSGWFYYNLQADNFKEIVDYDCWLTGRKLKYYKVYDYDMNLIDSGKGGQDVF